MNLDMERILKDMVDSMAEATKDEVGELGNFAKQALENQKESLKELGEAKMNGDIDKETFVQELEREKKVMEAELLTLEIMAKVAVQKAVNAAIKVFEKSLKALI